MLDQDDLKNVIHAKEVSQKDALLLILKVLNKPASAKEIVTIGLAVGVRKIPDWNLSSILNRAQGSAIKTDKGWELTQSGNNHIQSLLKQIGFEPKSVTTAMSDPNPTTEPTSNSSGMDIFVSHASKDLALVGLVVRLLTSSLGVPKSRIRCTSIPGCRLPAGSDPGQQLAADIRNSPAFIGLITESSVGSAYVLFELGARWVLGEKIVPLIGPKASYDLLPGPIKHVHALKTTSRTDLQQMVREIAIQCGRQLQPPEAYEEDLQALLDHTA